MQFGDRNIYLNAPTPPPPPSLALAENDESFYRAAPYARRARSAFVEIGLYKYQKNMPKSSRGALHASTEETARQIRGLSYKVFIVTW